MPSNIFHNLTDKLMSQTFSDIDNLKEDYYEYYDEDIDQESDSIFVADEPVILI